ncbi:MAG TPA: glutamate-5-semialdehyde dehydrogenase [Myxococcota bacterium]
MPIADVAAALAARARTAARVMSVATTAQKNAVLNRIATALTTASSSSLVLAGNARDLDAAEAAGLAAPMIDRLRLDDTRLAALAGAVTQIIGLPDPVGRIAGLGRQPSGIVVGRMQVPLGVILMIYESRPNVTVDTTALCLKAGNAVILRGGKEALHTNTALATLVVDALVAEGLPKDAALFVDDTDRELLYALLRRAGEIDLAIPRGGTTLIDAVNEHARVPVIQHYQGICHVYVHAAADLAMAERIVVNAKVSRPGVCNSTEGLVVDAAIADRFIPQIVGALRDNGVDVVGCDRTVAIDDRVGVAGARDFDTEFLGLKIAVKVVDGEDDATAFIAAHGSQHTESIVTNDHAVAMRFLRAIDASCVLVNASTRFNDGGELGLGAELGISTTKLHAYGPMGLDELCTKKFVVLGHGEVR